VLILDDALDEDDDGADNEASLRYTIDQIIRPNEVLMNRQEILTETSRGPAMQVPMVVLSWRAKPYPTPAVLEP